MMMMPRCIQHNLCSTAHKHSTPKQAGLRQKKKTLLCLIAGNTDIISNSVTSEALSNGYFNLLLTKVISN